MGMRFIDRQPELGRLEAFVDRQEGGLAVIWGRRRIGKTRLLLEWCEAHGGAYAVADQSSPEIQRRHLAVALAEALPGFSDAEYPTWDALFARLAREAANASWTGPLILDEFPYLVASSSELPSVFQRWLDHAAKKARLRVAIAGSSQRMMQGLVLDANAPLYGRAVEAFQLSPLAAGFVGDALGIRDALECVKAYAVWGGVPRYWEITQPFGTDLDAALDACVLDPHGPLHTEPERLLLEELPPALSLRPILDAIGMGAHRVSEIAGRIGQPATALTRPLARLREMGLVAREAPFGSSEKSGKRALYRIADPFLRMWFRVVAPQRGILARASRKVRAELWRRERERLFAESWEDLCRRAIPAIAESDPRLGRGSAWLPAARYWHGGGPEWDAVTSTVDGSRLLVGEAKWSEQPVADIESIAARLAAKGAPPVAGTGDTEVFRCVLVPRVASGTRRPRSVVVKDARSVLNALR